MCNLLESKRTNIAFNSLTSKIDLLCPPVQSVGAFYLVELLFDRLPEMHESPLWRTIVAGSCGALNVFVNVAKIRSDAFWFSAMP
jgi:hypothetical protein